MILNALKKQQNFNDSEKLLADYILTNTQEVLDASIQELAAKTFVATSTIYRLCRKIGLKGYKDFKIKLSGEWQRSGTANQFIDPDFPFDKEDSNRAIAKKLLDLSIDSLKYTEHLMTDAMLDQAISYLNSAKKIGIFGYGSTYISALNFQNKLMKIDKRIELTTVPGESHQLAFQFGEGDCAIILSYSGQTKYIYEITKLLKQRKTKIIAITSNSASHIALLSDLSIEISKQESQSIKLATFSSQLAIDYVLNTLYSCLYVNNFESNQQTRIASELALIDERFFD